MKHHDDLQRKGASRDVGLAIGAAFSVAGERCNRIVARTGEPAWVGNLPDRGHLPRKLPCRFSKCPTPSPHAGCS
jgi:hypothetical protein